jgi:hypothetical protein
LSSMFLRFVLGSLLSYPLFSTTWLALFLALFFPQLRVFNNFSALFFGLFRFVFQRRSIVFNNFSALFFKITSFYPISLKNTPLTGILKTTILAHKSQENSYRAFPIIAGWSLVEVGAGWRRVRCYRVRSVVQTTPCGYYAENKLLSGSLVPKFEERLDRPSKASFQ